MDETANEIEAHIAQTQQRLGSNLRELEHKIEAATDWREHYRERPYLFLGAAVVGGVALAAALRQSHATREVPDGDLRRFAGSNGTVQAQACDLWNTFQVALVGVAVARITNYIGGLIPGFDEHYRRAEQRAAAVNPIRTDS